MELIDFKKKGNAVRLYFGENGTQWGDDWDDAPYEYNAGTVYPEYIKQTIDMFVPVGVDVEEPADDCTNSSYCKADFIHKKSWVIWIEKKWGDKLNRDPAGIFFGDTLDKIKEKTKEYCPIFVEVKE